MKESHYSLSTSWNSHRHTNGQDIIKEIIALGFDTVELDWALTKDAVNDILAMKDSGKINISSLHNMCPLPDGVGPDEATPDYYSLSSPDDNERKLAISAAKNTIDYAVKAGAGAVVLHTGRIYLQDRTRRLGSLVSNDAVFDRLKIEMVKEREEKKAGYLDNVIRSLDELVPYAVARGISLSIENRYYYREIPLIGELETIFKQFSEGTLYYWHDVGHAEVFDRLGLARHKDFLEKFSNRLIGLHLHDIIGVMDDHRPPGIGRVDFNILRPYMNENTIKVLEIHEASAPQVQAAAKFLDGIFYG